MQFGPPGYELNLLYLACLAALVLGGSGPLAKVGQAFVGIAALLRLPIRALRLFAVHRSAPFDRLKNWRG